MAFIDGSSPQFPNFYELLSNDDKTKYWELRKTVSNSDKRYKKNKRIESLLESLDMIKAFCVRNDGNDWKRCLVCGVCWMGQDIAINIRQLRLLIDKCKSSINGALSKMGYSTAPIKSSIAAALLQYIPFLKGNFVEQRQWTVRRRIQFSPIPMRNFSSPYTYYQLQTPEPSTPYPQMNCSSSSTTSPETPQERDVRVLFGAQNMNFPQNLIVNNSNNLAAQNANNSDPSKSFTQSSGVSKDAQNENKTVQEIPSKDANTFAEGSSLDDNEDCLFANDELKDREPDESYYNFLTDPCCCCPVNWTNDANVDQGFTLG